MTKQAKKFRSVLCTLVAFVLSVALTILAICCSLRATALNPSYAQIIVESSDYAEQMQSELKREFVSYGNACNVDESFFDDAFDEIITTEQIDSDTKTCIKEFYDNNVQGSVDTADVEQKLLEALKVYATEKGYDINDAMTESLSVMAGEMGDLYNAYIGLFSSSYFNSAARMLDGYMPFFNYLVIGLAAVAVLALVIIRLSFKKQKNYLRFYIYATCGATLMLTIAPTAALIMKIGSKINISNASLYGFASDFINYIFVGVIVSALIMAAISAILFYIRGRAVKENK